MISADQAQLAQWTPDFSSSGQLSPTWTRATLDGQELTNSLEYVDWLEGNPVQVILCEDCGFSQCASGGYLNVSRLGDVVLWSSPQVDLDDKWEASEYAPSHALRRLGAVVVTDATWSRWGETVAEGLPEPQWPQATRRELLDAWLLELRGRSRVEGPSEVVPMLRKGLLAADSTTADAAIGRVAQALDWLQAEPHSVLTGSLVALPVDDMTIESLYFDGPGHEDWPCLATLLDGQTLAFGKRWAYLPGDGELPIP